MNNLSPDLSDNTLQPPAMRMRPKSLAQYIGQQHLLAVGKPLPHAIKAEHSHSMVFWGSPDTGKITLAEVIARYANADVERISAVISGVKEIREAIERVRQSRNTGRRTIPSASEAHRFSKGQQNVFLPHTKNGTIAFIGATTENSLFELGPALLSRACVYPLKSLSTEDIEQILAQAMEDKTRDYGNRGIVLLDEAQRAITELVNGDACRALNTLEMMADMAEVDGSGKQVLEPELLTEIAGERSTRFDNRGGRFHDPISALYKSVRGNAPGVMFYRYVRIIIAGGDPLYVMRRCLVITSEDVGGADPRAMQVAIAAWNCFTRVDPAEGERATAQTIVYLACMSKGSAAYAVSKAALMDARELPGYDVSVHLRNAPTKLMKEMGHGQEYRYAHDEVNAYAAGEAYFPPEITQTRYCFPINRGLEGKTGERLVWLTEQDQNSPIKRYR